MGRHFGVRNRDSGREGEGGEWDWMVVVGGGVSVSSGVSFRGGLCAGGWVVGFGCLVAGFGCFGGRVWMEVRGDWVV